MDKQKNELLIEAKNISMTFRMPTERIDNLKEYVIKLLKRKLHYKNFTVLKDVNFEVKKGQSLALIGKNGAGKSTLLRIIAGIIEPSSGYIKTNGNMVPLLKLGAGFDMDATAKENIFLNGAMLGFSKKEMSKKFESIVEWAELQDFMNVPLKNFSSGMMSRLGFAIAIDVKPDILLIDEILGVGDAYFQKKCAAKIEELKNSGTTFIIVSHNMNSVKSLCPNSIYLKNGEIFMEGDTDTVVAQYLEDMK